MPPTAETQRLIEYEHWHSALSPSALAARLAMSPAGAFLTNAPVFQLKENLKLEPWMRTLDVGCGAGSALRILDERVHFEAAPVGLDFSPAVLRRARGRERGPDRGPEHATQPEFVLGEATTLPFRNGAFDFVMSGYLVRHLDDDAVQRFTLEVRRVLAPGGLALLWDYAPTGNPRLDAWNEAVLSPGGQKTHLRSTRALMALGDLAGFEYIRPARLRPFLLPPIPRASVLLGRPPEGWTGATPGATPA